MVLTFEVHAYLLFLINDIINECSLAWKVRYVRNFLIHGSESWPMKTQHDVLMSEHKLVTKDECELKMKQIKN